MKTTRRPPSRATLWTVNPPALGARTMTEIAGVSITDVTSFGWSDDGEHIWVMRRRRLRCVDQHGDELPGRHIGIDEAIFAAVGQPAGR